MAITATELLNINMNVEAVLSAKYQKNELRTEAKGALDAYAASTPQLVVGGTATLESIRQSSNKKGQISVFQKTAATVGSARSCNSSSSVDSTAVVTPTWVLKSANFFVPVAALGENIFSVQQFIQHQMEQRMNILHTSLDELCLTHLESNKSQVNAGTLNTFNGATDTMEVSLANITRYFGSIQAEMQQNNFPDTPYYNVHTLGEMVYQVNAQTAQGMNNATNLNWQLTNGQFQHYGSSNFDIATGTSGGSYVFVPGTTGIVSWARPDFRNGYTSGDTTWTTIQDPKYPWITWELLMKTGCTDQSGYVTANAGYEAGYGVSYHLSAEFSTLAAYTSNTDTGIYKYHQKTS